MEVKKTEYLAKITLGSLKKKPELDTNDLRNEILSFIEDEYSEYESLIELEEVSDDKPKSAI